jgi:hypothetical protein
MSNETPQVQQDTIPFYRPPFIGRATEEEETVEVD